jgi:hypothetical protein
MVKQGRRAPRAERRPASRQPKGHAAAGAPDAPPLFEAVEPRLLLDGNPVISEFMADNSTTLYDSFGDTSDWIELYNSDTRATADLTGWELRCGNTTWDIPSMSLGPAEYRIIFASGRNLTDPDGELHTNFRISKSGEDLKLVDPMGRTVQSWTPFPAQAADVSYGVGFDVSETKELAAGALAKYYIPTSGALGLTWTGTAFSDASWASGPTGIGFADSVPGLAATIYKANIGIGDLATALAVINNSGYQTWVQSETAPYINYLNTGGSGEFAADRTFPGMAIGVEADCYVLKATGKIHVASAGTYTFGVNSDDGFSLRIAGVNTTWVTNATNSAGTDTVEYNGLRGPADTLAQYYFSAPGDYDLTLIMWENGGGSSCELWAAQGAKSAYDSTFRLVGDTVHGGLPAVTAPIGGSGGGIGFAGEVRTDVRSAMQSAIAQVGGPTSLYVRLTFDAPDLASLESLLLKMKYDDGFVAYLNGTQIARRNAPASVAWNSVASSERTSDTSAATFSNIDVTPYLYLLTPTGNVLAIQVLLSSASDADLLVVPELSQIVSTAMGEHYFSVPSPGAPNTIDTWRPDITFSAEHGFYYAPFDLALATSMPGGTIYYTLDGSAPSAGHGTAYTVPFYVGTTATVRAVTVCGGHAGVTSTATYIFPADVINQPSNPPGMPAAWGAVAADYAMDTRITQDPAYKAGLAAALLSLPTISIVTETANLFDPSTGIYSNPYGNGVVPISAEYIDPDGGEGFQINAAMQMYGGVGRDPGYKKHSFRLQFKSPYGPSKLTFPLFGEGAAGSFDTIVMRSNFNDGWTWGGSQAQFIRDQFADRSLLAMGQPAGHGNFVLLYFNGVFWGLYNPVERPDAAFDQTYLGGDKANWDAINAGNPINEGDANEYNALMGFAYDNGSLAAYEKVQGNNPDGTRNPAYPVLLDMKNYVDYMLMNFFIGNADWPGHNYYMGRLNDTSPSQLDSTGFKSFPWDSEMAMGLQWLRGPDANVTGASGGIATPYQYLRNNAEFRLLFADEARKFLLDGGCLTDAVTRARYQALIDEVQASIVLESARWGDVMGGLNTPATWAGEANYVLNTWLASRAETLLAQLRSAALYPTIDAPSFSINGVPEYGGLFNPNDTLTMSGPPAATIYYTLDGSDPRLLGGAVSGSAIPYSSGLTLTQGTRIMARAYSGGVWSALSDVSFYVNLAPSIRITEVMYHPADPSAAEIAAGYASAEDFEFIEIRNIGSRTLPLAGLRLSNGVAFTFAAYALSPGAYVLAVSNADAFKMRYPAVSASLIAGAYTGHLNNGGEKVELDAPNGGIVHEFTYRSGWFYQTDGEGFSLTIRDPLQALPLWDGKDGWRSSAAPGGSPGASDSLPLPGSVVVSEVLSHTSVAPGDMIELHNTTDQPVPIGGWFVSDSKLNLTKYQIAAGTTLAAHGYLVLTEDGNFGDLATDPGRRVAFALSEHGDQVYLTSNAGGEAGGYREDVDFGGAPDGVATGLVTKTTGGTDFTLLRAPTFGSPVGGVYPGGPNGIAYVSPLVVNEIMYHPPDPRAAEQAAGFLTDEDFEFLELYNRSAAPLTLADFYVGDGVGFTFGWIPDGVRNADDPDPELCTPREFWTLESGATATWTAGGLAAGDYTVYAHYTLRDGDDRRRTLDDAARYAVTHAGGTSTVVIDQNRPAVTEPDVWVSLGTFSFDGTASVVLTRGDTGPNNWTIADSVKFVRAGQPDVVASTPALDSFFTATGMTALAPGGYVVLVSNYAAFDARYDAVANQIPVAGVYTGRLNNAGEMLRLYQAGNWDAGVVTPTSGIIPYYQTDHVNYNDSGAWVSSPDGHGSSLIRTHQADYGNEPANWDASAVPGTPGAANAFVDRTAPSVPGGLAAHATVNPDAIALTWSAVADDQSYVDHYVIYRNGTVLGVSAAASYADATAEAMTPYAYRVSAVNRDGYEGGQSLAVYASRPGIVTHEVVDSRHLTLTFSQPLDPATAGVLGRYAMSGGITLSAVALSRGNTRVTLTTNQDIASSTSYTITMTGLTTASGDQLPATLLYTFDSPSSGTGTIGYEYWLNIGGSTISDLVAGTNNFAIAPTGTSILTSFEGPTDWADNYGSRIRGYITAPTTGTYYFWIASDDYSELYLSTNSSPGNKVRIAYVYGWTSSRAWTWYASQQSAGISLVAGQRYYIEAVQKEGGGGDNLCVRWQLPGGTIEEPIPGSRLAPYGGTVDHTPPTVPANLRATLTGSTQVNLAWDAAIDLESGVDHYTIYRDGAAYATRTTTTFTDTDGISSMSRHAYQVAAVNYDGFASALSAAASVAPAGLASVGSVGDATHVRVAFTEPLDRTSAQTVAHYQVSGVTVTAAVLEADNFTVTLTTTSLGSSQHTLTVSNVQTLEGTTLPVLSTTFTNTLPGWSATVYKSNQGWTIGSLAQAQSVIDTPAYQSWVRSETVSAINYTTYASAGHFYGASTPDRPIPGESIGYDINNYVIRATGTVYVPSPGNWTFGVNSDDGFRLTVGANSFQYDGGRGQADSFATFNFASAGSYAVSLLHFQGGGPSEVEVFAESGSVSSWNANFRLVGDTAHGGLAMASVFTVAPFTVGVDSVGSAGGAPALTGTVSNPSVGVTVRVSGTYYAATNNGDGTWTVPYGALTPLGTGTYNVTAMAIDNAKQVAFDSTLAELRIDGTAPTATITPVSPDPRDSPVDSVAIEFSEAVTHLDIRDFYLTLDGLSAPITGATLSTADNRTWTLGNLAGLTAAGGAYVLTLQGVGSGIVDLAGNELMVGASDAWMLGSTGPTVQAVTLNLVGRHPGQALGAMTIEPSGIGVQQIRLALSKAVTVAASGNVVTGIAVEIVAFDQAGNPISTTALTVKPDAGGEPPAGIVWLSGSGTSTLVLDLGQGRVTDTWVRVTLMDSGVTDMLGSALDGEARTAGHSYVSSGADLPTGDGEAGGSTVFYVGSLLGDFTRDGAIGPEDVDAFVAKFNDSALDADFRGVGFGDVQPDGLVTGADVDAFLSIYSAAVVQGRRLGALPQPGPLSAGDPEPLAVGSPREAAPELTERSAPPESATGPLAILPQASPGEAAGPALAEAASSAVAAATERSAIPVSGTSQTVGLLAGAAVPLAFGAVEEVSPPDAPLAPDGGIVDLLALPALAI